MFENAGIYLVYALFAVTGILAAELVYFVFTKQAATNKAVNRRLRLQEKAISQKDVLVQLRKERGIDENAPKTSLTKFLTRIHTQSAMRMPLATFTSITSIVAAVIGITVGLYTNKLIAGFLIAFALMIVLPMVILRRRRQSRHKAFENQFPDAIDLISRGLKAGHPVPTAVSMVGREMPDPIGTEFGMVSDEVAYGATLVQALRNLYERMDHPDLALFITAVSIQSSTGGNLREILDGLSSVIRGRAKLRRKIKAISVEGRMSAYILTAVPAMSVGAVTILTPSYYAEVIHEKMTWVMILGSLIWLGVGNLILFRMTKFKF